MICATPKGLALLFVQMRPTEGLDEKRAMPYMVAIMRVVLALFATVFDIHDIVCFGALPVRVRCHFYVSHF